MPRVRGLEQVQTFKASQIERGQSRVATAMGGASSKGRAWLRGPAADVGGGLACSATLGGFEFTFVTDVRAFDHEDHLLG